MRRYGFLICLSLFLFISAKGQVKASLEDSELLMGNTTKLEMLVPLPNDSANVEFPALKEAIMQNKKYLSLLNDTIEILTTYNRALEEFNGVYNMRYDLLVQAFDSGTYNLPSLEFIVAGEKITSNPVKLTVLPVKVKADDKLDDFSDIATPFELNEELNNVNESESKALLWWLVSILGLLVVFLILYMFMRKSGTSFLLKNPPKPYEIALEKLSKLKKQNYPQRGKSKEYYTKLTEILRVYIRKQYGIKTFEKTSSEILMQVENNEFIDKYTDLLKSIFVTADYVKFAKVNPSETENNRCMADAVLFVKNSHTEGLSYEGKGGEK